ncbi:hypothetical protein DOJK_00596 [Patescibacteria group bacterium]|uniref:helix-turn-helix transcriptional regulator n=1 Tax=Geobacter sp. TaxID=46610 RepID=UPI001AC9FA57|nr:helix-turn-helix domain-containing protein [Geobacter sp.]CAG1020822.1 hypothetical protein DOJK_00596 [Patescibacteria group bacterium]
MNNEYININELTQLYGCSKATIYRYAKANKLKAIKRLGDCYLWFKRSEIESFIRPKVGRKSKHNGGN